MSSTDLPEAPTDPQRLAVIDKLAQFVARNGPEFEHMTMEKQYGNPDFSFLFGGEFSDYYKRKVEEFKMSMPQKNQHPTDVMPHQSSYHLDSMPPHPQWGGQPYNQGWDEGGDNWNNPSWQHPPSRGNWGPNWGPQNGPPAPWCNGPYPANFYPPPFPPHHQPQLPQLTEEDVKHSEANLKAQYDKIIGEEQPQAIRHCLDRARMEAFTNSAASLSVNPDDVSSAIQPIIELCTKENIAKGKNFAVETMSKSDEHANLLADYLLLRVQASEATFETRLYIIYLINDLLHYLKRHSDTANFLPALNRVIVPIYSLALESADDEKRDKLTRVLNLWESNAYLSTDILKNMQEEEERKAFMDSWKAEQDRLYADKISQVESEHKARYESLKKQHDDFAEHVRKTLAASTEIEQQQLPDPGGPRQPFPEFGRYGPPPPQGFSGPGWGPGNGVGGHNFDGPPQWHGPPPPHFMPGPPPMSERWRRDMPPSYHPDEEYYDARRGGPLPPQMPYRGGPPRDRFRRDGRFDEPFFEERPYRGRRRFDAGDSFNESASTSRCGEDDLAQENRLPAVKDEDFIPTVPFWQLPAALMHSLIGAKDFEFKPLDPSKLRLLPPKPPSEQLMQALDAYYSQPSHDRPRDPEGWERLGLYEFYRSKKEAKEGSEVAKKSSSRSSSSSNKNDQPEGLPQLAYLTAYPKSAIGQAIRTGPAALIGVPPPDLLLPKMNAQFAAAAAAAAAINNSELLKQPPPTPSMMSQPPPGMIAPPQSQPPVSSNTQPSRPTRFTSALVPPRRRSRSPSRSYSGSRSPSRSRSDSRSYRSRSRSSSRSRSRSRSRSSGSRSRSSPSDRRYRDRSRSPRSSDGSITTAGFMRRNVGGGGSDQRNARRGGMGNSYPPPQQWSYDHPPPPPLMVPSYDRRGGPPGQMYPPYRGGGVGFRGNGYNASSPPPQAQPMGNGHRGGPYYGGGNSYGNPNRRGGGGYQGR